MISRLLHPTFLAAVALWISVLPLPAADGLRYKTVRNIDYREGENLSEKARERCRLDIYYPENVKDYATVVWFHGGGLTEGSRAVPEKLKEKGIAVVAAGYRLSPDVSSPTYVEDAAAALAWVFQNIEKYGGASSRIFVSGHSAGGYLTLMLGLDKHYLAAHGIDANSIAGLIPFSGQAITHFTVRKERGISEKQPVVDGMAPLYHARGDAPPLLLITGDRDLELLGRYEENAYLWRMMKIAGHKTTELQELKGLNHGAMADPAFDLVLPFIQEHTKTPVAP